MGLLLDGKDAEGDECDEEEDAVGAARTGGGAPIPPEAEVGEDEDEADEGVNGCLEPAARESVAVGVEQADDDDDASGLELVELDGAGCLDEEEDVNLENGIASSL